MDPERVTARCAARMTSMPSGRGRVQILGTPPRSATPGAMTSYLYERKVRAFDHPCFAEPFRDELGENAERPAAEADIEIGFNLKEDRVKESLVRRG